MISIIKLGIYLSLLADQIQMETPWMWESGQRFSLTLMESAEHWATAYFSAASGAGDQNWAKITDFYVESTERPIIEEANGVWIIHFNAPSLFKPRNAPIWTTNEIPWTDAPIWNLDVPPSGDTHYQAKP